LARRPSAASQNVSVAKSSARAKEGKWRNRRQKRSASRSSREDESESVPFLRSRSACDDFPSSAASHTLPSYFPRAIPTWVDTPERERERELRRSDDEEEEGLGRSCLQQSCPSLAHASGGTTYKRTERKKLDLPIDMHLSPPLLRRLRERKG